MGPGERQVPRSDDAADGHATGVALDAHRPAQRADGARAGPGRHRPRRLRRRTRLAAAAAGRGRCAATAGVVDRHYSLHPQDDPGRGADRARGVRPVGTVRDRGSTGPGRAADRAAGAGDVRIAVGQRRDRRRRHRTGAPPRQPWRDRPGAGRQGRWRRGRYRAGGNDRVAAGNRAQRMAVRTGQRDRAAAARPVAEQGRPDAARVAGAIADVPRHRAARRGAHRRRLGRAWQRCLWRPLRRRL